MARALDFFVVEGIKTSIPLHRRIVADPEFIAGRLSTRYMEEFFEREKRRAAAAEAEPPEAVEGGAG
jgi:acetyl-CoA carboxylase biotin carboxylase subunit